MSGDGGPSHILEARTVDELVALMEGGSRSAGQRLVRLAVHAGSSRQTGEPGDATLAVEPSDVIDRVARSAAGGSSYGLETLIDVVMACDLAGPALSRVVPAGVQPEDVTQDVLVAMTSSIHRFRGEARFTTWFYALARNVAISHLRRHHRPVDPMGGDEAVRSRRRLSSVVSERTVVQAAVATLPPKFQDVVRLRDLQGLSYAEIAERTGLKKTTVRSRLARGRAMLSTRLT